jgi:hypothetical protein
MSLLAVPAEVFQQPLVDEAGKAAHSDAKRPLFPIQSGQ